jgi:hypothetical protein
MSKKDGKEEIHKLFDEVKNSFLEYDPAQYIQNNLTLDGEKFSVLDNGWKFMADVYRYIALEATRKNGKPVVLCKGRQVGATVMAAALDLYFTNSGLFISPPIRIAHLFPALALVKRFSQDKLESLIRSAKDDKINKNKLIHKDNNAVDNITMKQFEAGTLWIESIGLDGDRVRGMTLDGAFFDEVQDMSGFAIGNATKTLTAAKYGPIGKGVQVYFGTPKERGSFFHRMWESSDQRYYHLGCKNCKGTYPFYLSADKDMWKEIWISGYIVKCPLCGMEQHKIDAIENGKWVATRSSEDSKYVGFHINQLYIPYFTKEAILDEMPEHNPNKSMQVFHNEVIGEFYSGSGMPLTRADIYENALDMERTFSKSISPKEKTAYLGVDWGGKIDKDEVNRGQSYSCTVILSAQADGTLLVEHAHKLRKHNFEYKKETIVEMFRRFGCTRGVSDWFFGQDVVYDLQMAYRDRFLGAQGSAALLKPLRYREDELMVTYNKNILIEEVFNKIRKGQIRFPGKDFEKIDWLIDHCTSMESDVKMLSGQQIKTFKKGGGPNDGLMALMYAYIAYKFDVTKGFTIKPGLQRENNMPRPVLAFAPRLKVD